MSPIRMLDTSNELYILRHQQGIKLISPENNPANDFTVKKALALPYCTYFLDTNSIKQNLNEYSAQACGFSSAKYGIRRSVAEVLSRSTAYSVMKNDRDVVTHNQMKITEEIALHKNNTTCVEALTIKVPWYSLQDDIIGVFGFSVIYGMHSIPEFINLMIQLNFFKKNQNLPWFPIKDNYLTQREHEVLRYTIKGHSASEVGKRLHLSQRTIEYHLENIKGKFGVATKSELIDVVVDSLIKASS